MSSPDSGNEMEMLSPEHKAWTDICYIGGSSESKIGRLYGLMSLMQFTILKNKDKVWSTALHNGRPTTKKTNVQYREWRFGNTISVDRPMNRGKVKHFVHKMFGDYHAYNQPVM